MAKEDPVAHSVAVQLPAFNKLAPASWFHLADANFHLRGIVQSETKYWYIVSKLDADTLRKLSAFLASKKGADPYGKIRAILCDTYEPKLKQNLDALLESREIGDERPSEYALELHCLLANGTTDDILKRIFIRSLPKNLANAISPSSDGSFDALAKAEDKAWSLAASSSTETSVHTVGSASALPRGRTGRQQAKLRNDCKNVILCRFHIKWGNAAKRCLQGCSRWEPKGHQQGTQVFHVEEEEPEVDTVSEN